MAGRRSSWQPFSSARCAALTATLNPLACGRTATPTTPFALAAEPFGGSGTAVSTFMTEWGPTGEWQSESAALLALPWLGLTLDEVWRRRCYQYPL